MVVGLLAAALGACGRSNAQHQQMGAGCSPTPAAMTCNILFVGNSYTAVNDLPQVFATLATSGGFAVSADARDPGGATFADHVADSDTAAALNGATFNVVVLQEQSQIPARSTSLSKQVLPAAETLVESVRRAGADPLLLQTWAHRDGWPEVGIHSYSQMQQAINAGYAAIARASRVETAPVGEAWAQELAYPSHPALWQNDGSHPTLGGTYLAACVLFASVFHRSPQGISYHGGVSRTEAAQLQAVAWAATVS